LSGTCDRIASERFTAGGRTARTVPNKLMVWLMTSQEHTLPHM
jgi:hypothetical protein